MANNLLSILVLVICLLYQSTKTLESFSSSILKSRFNHAKYQREFMVEMVQRQRRIENKEFVMNTDVFTFWNDDYENWSRWTTCQSESCTKSRFRVCKDSLKRTRTYWPRQKKCATKYIYERSTCNDTVMCATNNFSNEERITKLPKKCGIMPDNTANKIYGGKEAEKNKWQAHVGFYIIKDYNVYYVCGGTLINPGWVVTAAHCLETIEMVKYFEMGKLINTRSSGIFDSFYILIGDHNKQVYGEQEIMKYLSHFIMHPSYRFTRDLKQYDVALLKLDVPLPTSLEVNYPCVGESGDFFMNLTTKCYAVGWGLLNRYKPLRFSHLELDFDLERWQKNPRSSQRASVLQEVEIPLVDFEKCVKEHSRFNLNKSLHVCAGTSSKDTCGGDSGGGLFCVDGVSKRLHLYGITNFGLAEGCGLSYGIYMRVPQVALWIRETIKN